MMAIALENSIRVYATPASSLTTAAWAVGGSNRVLVAAVMTSSLTPVQPTACKWGGSGGTSMTLVGGSSYAFYSYRIISMYTLTAPTAQTSTGYVSWASSHDEVCAFFLNYTGVDQTDPLHSIAKTTATIGMDGLYVTDDTTPTQPWSKITVNTASGDKVIAITSICPSSSSIANLTISTSSGMGTQRLKADNADLAGWEWCAISDADATGPTFEFGWELHTAAGTTYSDGKVGISLKPASSFSIAVLAEELEENY